MRFQICLTATLLVATAVASAPSEAVNASVPKNSNLPKNETHDSHLEHVHVKQETGFDGKVRSIRFSLEPEAKKNIDRSQSEVPVDERSKSKYINTDIVEAAPPLHPQSETTSV